MSEFTRRIGRATKRAIEDAETRVLANEGRKSLKAKVARVKRVTKKALKAGAIAGAVVATAVVMRDRKRRRALDA
jgi:hypothetical protein